VKANFLGRLNNDSRHSNTQEILLIRTRARIVHHGPTFAGETQNTAQGVLNAAMSQEREEELDLRLKSTADGEEDHVTQPVPAPKHEIPSGRSLEVLNNCSKPNNC
jgi:hypothetical protein